MSVRGTTVLAFALYAIGMVAIGALAALQGPAILLVRQTRGSAPLVAGWTKGVAR